MFTYRSFLVGGIMVAILVVGIWLGSHLNQSPQIIPTASAQGVVVNQENPDLFKAAAFTVGEGGAVLYWWQIQNNGLGKTIVFDSRTGHVRERDFRR
jgi:hypothetical protein